MAEIGDVLPDKTRKTFSMTHRQAGITATVAAVLYALQPTLAKFQTKDLSAAEMQTMQVQVTAHSGDLAEVKASVKEVNANVVASKTEIVELIRRVSDSQKQREAAAELRQREIDGRQDRHIEMIESKAMKRAAALFEYK